MAQPFSHDGGGWDSHSHQHQHQGHQHQGLHGSHHSLSHSPISPSHGHHEGSFSHSPSHETVIPLILHFMWKQKDGKYRGWPKRYQKYIDSWKKYCPDFKIVWWTNAEIDQLWQDPRWSKHKPTYDRMRLIEQCDYTRYAIMYQYGGVYVDLNTMCYKDIKPVIQGRRICLAEEPIENIKGSGSETLVTNAFLASAPGQEFWIEFMDHVANNYWSSKSAFDYVMVNTGPYALGRFIKRNYNDSPEILMDKCMVQPYIVDKNGGYVTSSECKGRDKPYIAKLWKDTARWGEREGFHPGGGVNGFERQDYMDVGEREEYTLPSGGGADVIVVEPESDGGGGGWAYWLLFFLLLIVFIMILLASLFVSPGRSCGRSACM